MPVPPAGFDADNANIPHGKVDESVSYSTRNYGMKKVSVYTPPGYTTAEKYPVLYLHHGIGGNEVSWLGKGSNEGNADNVMDYLYSKQLAKPMIVVMPNGKMDGADDFARFANWEDVLLKDLIPFIEKTYSAATDADRRAISGLSMGGGQTLNFGFPHTDIFHYIGAYSSAPNTKPPAQTIPNVATIKQNLKVIFISCGDQDGLIGNSERYHEFLNDNGVDHIWQIEPGQAHTKTVWNRSLYNFAQRIFLDVTPGGGGGGAGGSGGMGGGGGAAGSAGAGGMNGGGTGGMSATGGSSSAGGAGAQSAGAGGSSATGGSSAMGGSPMTGGAPSSAGAPGNGEAGTAPTAGSGSSLPDDDGGCTCAAAGGVAGTNPTPFALLALLGLLRRRRHD